MTLPVAAAVVNKLADYLRQEASLMYGVRDEVEWLERELRGMLCFLKDADSKEKANDEGVRNWVRDIREVAYDVEDAIESFMIEVSRPASIHRYSSALTSVIPRCKIAKKIKSIKSRISELSARRATYGIANLGEGGSFLDENMQARRRLSPHHYDDSSVVGLEEDKKMMLEHLLSQEKRRSVISVVGMGGLGKTTLAKKIYNSGEVIAEFQFRAWVSVSKEYSVIELLKKIMKAVMGVEATENLDEEELKAKLYESLKNQGRYLVVMDDVWRKKVWERIGTAFPDVGNGSRVILTTRHIDVARSADPAVPPYALRLLDESESRKLFLKKVYPYQDVPTIPKELEDVGQELVKKCRGLPLALVVLGGLLSVKEKTHHEWSTVLRNSNWQFTEGKECLAILALSYEDLPYELKPCFLYVGSFPEDSEISASQLIKLWTAEGFIVQSWQKTREERARDFLHELVQRCMVQVADKEYFGTIKSIRIHDLLRDLCLDEAKEGFLMVRKNHMDDTLTFPSDLLTARRLALHNYNDLRYLNSATGRMRVTQLHTLLGFNFRGDYDVISRTIGRALHGLKLLRVIDVEIQVGEMLKSAMLPKEITTMIHLRYLRWIIHYTGSLFLPSVLNLRNLRTMDVEALTVDSNGGIGKLKHLQELAYICAGRWIERDLPKLTSLQKLEIFYLKPCHEKSLVGSLGKLDHLESLLLQGESIPPQVPAALSNKDQLRALELVGPFSQTEPLLSCGGFPSNLTELSLVGSKLEQDPMPMLENLPNLIDLRLGEDAFMGKRMTSSACGFPRLQRMTLINLPELEEWRVEVRAFPSLTHLTITACQKLKELPEGLQQITTLKELELVSMPREFTDRVRHKEWEIWYRIVHIPSITIR